MTEKEKTDQIKVKKNNGELEDFDEGRLRASLQKAGAKKEEIAHILSLLKNQLFHGITTKKIYQKAYELLYKKSYHAAGRFRLKKALYQMGPSGYPFEHFVSRLLQSEGYEVETGQIVQGRCVNHEVDVIARKGNEIIMGECKFHHSDNAKSDVKISLYVHSRFLDIKEQLMQDPANKNMIFKPLLISNTRFTDDAVQFGKCAGLKIISWDYPQGNALKDWIDRSGFHPITSLKSLLKKEKEALLNSGKVLCRDILDTPEILNDFMIPHRRKKKLIKEAEAIIARI